MAIYLNNNVGVKLATAAAPTAPESAKDPMATAETAARNRAIGLREKLPFNMPTG